MTRQREILLIDLPTFPKGVMALSFPAIAASFPPGHRVCAVDLNLEALPLASIIKNDRLLFAGLKVSCQNVEYARRVTRDLKAVRPDLTVVWGGEYPSLLPLEAGHWADTVVTGAFESVVESLLCDVEAHTLQKRYVGRPDHPCASIQPPDYSVLRHRGRYLRCFGLPLETSRGCDRKCTFCMVHVMQPSRHFKSLEQLQRELAHLDGEFVNVVDYNVGMSHEHLANVTTAFSGSRVKGWMAEMCLESLDDDALLGRLANSRCRIVYCGLESVSEFELRSVNKSRTNNVENYERVIRKAQSHGIQIAAGAIVGLKGATRASIDQTFAFYEAMGLIYAKITFLIYNPGTRVHQSMKRVGQYITTEVGHFDGNHPTFAHPGIDSDEVLVALRRNIRTFYSNGGIRKRARNAGVSGRHAEGFANFNRVYREPYLKWLRYNVFENETRFAKLLEAPFRKSPALQRADTNAYTLQA